MSKRIVTKIGDIFQIPLPNGKKGFAQYVYKDKKYADLLQVFDYILDKNKKIDLEKIICSRPLFSPVITSVLAAVKYHKWEKIGNFPVTNFKYPGFVNGWPGYWFLWDGEKEIKLGSAVPKAYQHLEYLQAYSPDLIAERILTGIKPNDEKIRTNKSHIE